MALTVSTVLFAIFVLNVVLGATTNAPFMGDVSEMLVLFGASIAFVAAILRREAQSRNGESQ